LAESLKPWAYAYLAVLFVGTLTFVTGVLVHLSRKGRQLAGQGKVPLSPGSVVPYLLSQRRYRMALALTAAPYGILYSFLTSIVVYRPDVDFSSFPGLAIPSIQPVQLAGAPLYVPELTLFLAQHLALVVIPLTVLMMVAVSVLVGVNLSITLFAYDNRAKGGGRSLGGQLGAVVGLFTGCPTCAGIYLFSVFGGSGAASLAVTLGLLQPVFILLCIPLLLATPYLTSRNLAKVFREGCIILR
jgi:hypothetical protein